eukprot:g3333.t1
MDTPGPNEAQAALKVELKLAIESADVIIYLLDYTKIGSTDEQQMFDQLRESCEAMISKQSSRFWFLLNKIDEKKEVDDIDKIKDFVSQRIRKMLKDIPIHPHQIVPISAKKAYFGRQAQFSEGERLHKDPEFRQEFEKIAFGESANSLKDSIPPEVFTMLATQAAESMVKGSEICSFEEQVLHSIMKDKERIMAEKLCDAAVSILDVVDNSAHFELAALGATQNTLTKRVEKGKALVERLKKQLMAMEKDIADKNHEENFEQIVAAAIDKMFGNAKKMIDFLFDARSLQELEVGLRVWVQLWGEDGKLKVPAKFKSREEAERFVQSQNTKLQSMLHQFCQYECKGMAIELNEASGKLQDDVRRAARPVLEFMLKEAGSMLDLNMKTESFRFQHVADTNVEELLKMGARHESLFNENTTKVQRSRIEKAPWYFLGLFRWGTYDKQIPYIAKVVDSHSVKGSSLKKLWKQHIGLAREEMHKLIMSGIKQVISYELKHAKDHIHHRCNELLTIISENHDRYELDCEAASSRKTELLAKCKRCSEILNYVKAVRKECGLVCNDSSSTEDTDLGEPTCTSCSEQGGEEDPPISPLCGPCDHAIDLQWEGDEEPFCVLIDGKPCASQGNGSLRSPKLPSHCGQFDVEIQWKRSLPMTAYSGAFTTHFPGEICSIEPSRGPTRGRGDIEDLEIVEVETIGGKAQAWQVVDGPSHGYPRTSKTGVTSKAASTSSITSWHMTDVDEEAIAPSSPQVEPTNSNPSVEAAKARRRRNSEFFDKVLLLPALSTLMSRHHFASQRLGHGTLQGRVLRAAGGLKRPRYGLYVTPPCAEEVLLIAAERQTQLKLGPYYVLSSNGLDFDRESPCFLGRLSGNAMCTHYLLHGQRISGSLREELAALRFRKPTDAPRRMHVPKHLANSGEEGQLLAAAEGTMPRHQFRYMVNSSPTWDANRKVYRMNFHNRVHRASSKNFQLLKADSSFKAEMPDRDGE